MDVKYVNPFIESFTSVVPELGFENVRVGTLSAKQNEVEGTGIVVVVGVVGELRGNVVYTMNTRAAKKIASTMMMGAPVDELDDMAKSALSELANMLTANAATCFSNMGIHVDISTPTMLEGRSISIKMAANPILCVPLLADDVIVEINISFQS